MTGRKGYSDEKIYLLFKFLQRNESFIDVRMDNFKILCEEMKISKPDQMDFKRNRNFHYLKLCTLFQKAKRLLEKEDVVVNGPNIGRAIFRGHFAPSGLEYCEFIFVSF